MLDAAQKEMIRMQYLEAMGIDQYVPRFELERGLPSLLRHAVRRGNDAGAMAEQPRTPLVNGDYLAEMLGQPDTDKRKGFNDDVSPAENTSLKHNNYAHDAPVLDDFKIESNQSEVTSELSAHSSVLSRGDSVSDPLSAKYLAETHTKIDVAEQSLRSLSDIVNAAKKETIKFSVSLWYLNNGMLVLDSRKPKQAMPTTSLLGRMLEYYGLRAEQTEPEVIQWPPAGVSLSKIEAGAEKTMVTSFLDSRIAAQPVAGLWIMGEAVYNSITLIGDDKTLPYSEILGSSIKISEQAIPAIVLPSLLDMLIDPPQKRHSWLALNRFLNNNHGA